MYNGYGKVPAYTDISHFRAPYKNAVISGFGSAATFGLVEKDGFFHIDPARKNTFLMSLAGYAAVPSNVGSDPETVTLHKFTPEQLAAAAASPEQSQLLQAQSAATWVVTQEAQGKVVAASNATVSAVNTPEQPVFSSSEALANYQLWAFDSGSKTLAAVKGAPAEGVYTIILAGQPGGKTMLASIGGPFGAVLIGAGVIGAYYVYKNRNRRSYSSVRSSL